MFLEIKWYKIYYIRLLTFCVADRCEALIKLARRLEMLVFCDDVYNLLAHRTEPKPSRRLFALDRPGAIQFGGHVISNGSFSKILAPGVRVGWLEVPPRITNKLRST
jgi:DNA-binding transcriptional MocR family regulator